MDAAGPPPANAPPFFYGGLLRCHSFLLSSTLVCLSCSARRHSMMKESRDKVAPRNFFYFACRHVHAPNPPRPTDFCEICRLLPVPQQSRPLDPGRSVAMGLDVHTYDGRLRS